LGTIWHIDAVYLSSCLRFRVHLRREIKYFQEDKNQTCLSKFNTYRERR
jgi:hypothetical protein